MKDEIKEILDRLFVYRNENDEMKYQPEDILTIEDVWLLLDYITNLQEERNDYKDRFNLMAKFRDKALAREWDYKSRIGKAIEYINKCKNYHKTYHGEDKMFADELESLIMILQGSDKE